MDSGLRQIIEPIDLILKDFINKEGDVMSETVIEKGKLTLIERLNNETLEEQCKRILNNKIDDFDLGWYKTYKEALLDEFYNDYYVHEDILYELDYYDLGFCEDIAEGEVKGDSSIDFLVSYHNGGTCLNEMLDVVMDKINKKAEVLNIEDRFIISTCLKCGSNDISIEEEIDYDWEENPYTSGYYLKCNCCGEINYN